MVLELAAMQHRTHDAEKKAEVRTTNIVQDLQEELQAASRRKVASTRRAAMESKTVQNMRFEAHAAVRVVLAHSSAAAYQVAESTVFSLPRDGMRRTEELERQECPRINR